MDVFPASNADRHEKATIQYLFEYKSWSIHLVPKELEGLRRVYRCWFPKRSMDIYKCIAGSKNAKVLSPKSSQTGMIGGCIENLTGKWRRDMVQQLDHTRPMVAYQHLVKP